MVGQLERFVEAQSGGIYETALEELRAGNKRTHWMWFVFPQLAGLGRSPTAQFYAVADRAEAMEYLGHELLGPRLSECTGAMLGWAGKRSAPRILGDLDAMKFMSSMTLFEAVSGEEGFARALDAFFHGERDQATLGRL